MGEMVFLTGMFRSGTTLMAKVMDANPGIAFASDPYRPFFNCYRDMLASDNGLLKEQHCYAPLNSYFFDREELELMRIICSSDFSRSLENNTLEGLKDKMAERAEQFSPFVAERMNEVTGRTFRELYLSMMALVKECYGSGDERVVGAKEVWCGEFCGPLYNAFGDRIKFINIVRDPRAVFASQYIAGQKYQWIFLIRQWRKLAIFAWLYANRPGIGQNTITLRYEDFVSRPEEHAKRVCDLLNVDFNEDMIDGNKFRDGSGNKWRQNSSFHSADTINRGSLDKWREVLNEQEIDLIERLCAPEMALYGYGKPERVSMLPEEIITSPLIIPREDLAEWYRPYAVLSVEDNIREMRKESARLDLLLSGKDVGGPGMDVVESMFLDERYFRYLKGIVKGDNDAYR